MRHMGSVHRLGVLVVEDDPEFLNLLCEHFASSATFGPLDWASDGAEALALLKKGVVPDLVLLDLELPGVHGLEILRHLRTDPSFQRSVVVVTGANGDPGPGRERFLPGEVWLAKPFRMDELEATIRCAISRLLNVVGAVGPWAGAEIARNARA